MNDKNIDRLFQEQLKNLEATPNKRVWGNIESKLKKKKRKVIPIWWFTSGIAALFLLGLFLLPFSDDKNNFNKNDSEIIITETPKEIKEFIKVDKKPINSVIQNKNVKEKVLIAVEKEGKKIIEKKKNTLKKTDEKKKLVSSKNAVEKIFLADNTIKENTISTKKETIISTEKKKVVLDKKDKKEITEIEKNPTIKKVDLNNLSDKKDTVFINKSIKSKWAIAPVFGVLNSNSFSNSSPIDKNLSNSTQGKNSFSFGVKVAYQINKKWTIQTGIHQQEMNYTNKQVIVASTASNLSSVAFSNGNRFSFKGNTAENFDFAVNSITNTVSSNGNLSQNYGYIEIPVEVKYNLSNNKKFETQLVAGFSSLFLNKNEVILNTSTFSESVEAKNLNNINFSGNLGFDFNYLVDKNWSLNFNPMFKAQLNTFSEKSNGFSPFNIGIYTGIKYSF